MQDVRATEEETKRCRDALTEALFADRNLSTDAATEAMSQVAAALIHALAKGYGTQVLCETFQAFVQTTYEHIELLREEHERGLH